MEENEITPEVEQAPPSEKTEVEQTPPSEKTEENEPPTNDLELNIQEAEETFEQQLAQLDKNLKTGNTAIINNSVGNLLYTVSENAFLYPKYIKKMFSMDAKYRMGLNPYDANCYMPNIIEWLNSVQLNVLDLMPVQEYQMPKYRPFESAPEDNTFMSIHLQFAATQDKLYTKMLGTNFNASGGVTTDGKKLLFTAYHDRSKKINGNYSHANKTFIAEEQVNPNSWDTVVPVDNPYKIYINTRDVLNFLYNSLQLSILNNTDTIAFCYGHKNEDGTVAKIAFDANYLVTCLESLIKLGHSELEIGFAAPNKPSLIYPKGKSADIKRHKTDFVLLMPFILEDAQNDVPVYDLDTNCVTFGQNLKDYCFDTITRSKQKADGRIKEIELALVNTQQQLAQAREEANAEENYEELEGVKINDIYMHNNFGYVKVMQIRQNKNDKSKRTPFIVTYDVKDIAENDFTENNMHEQGLQTFRNALVDTKNIVTVDNALNFINVLAT